MVDYLIDMQNVDVRYPTDDGGEVTIINNVNLRVRKGEFVAVVGPSGCGKSTLFRMLQGSQFPTEGVVLVNGHQVTHVTRDCGIVYQNYSLYPDLTVEDNVAVGLMLEGTTITNTVTAWPYLLLENVIALLSDNVESLQRARSKRGLLNALKKPFYFVIEKFVQLLVVLLTFLNRLMLRIYTPKYLRVRSAARAEARVILQRCGLDPDKDSIKYPFELSGGMRQRVAVAQAVIMKPRILLMDEPFGALDEQVRREMQDFIHERWKQDGLTVFFVTHELEEAVKLGTRVVCLSQFWKDVAGNQGIGARIMIDRQVTGGSELPSAFVGTPEFTELCDDIRTRALTKKNPHPESAFVLTHDDAHPLVQILAGGVHA